MQENIPLKNGKMLTIREAMPKDAAAMIALSKVVGGETDFLLTDKNGWTNTVENEQEMLAAWVVDPISCMFLDIIDDEIVGFFSVMPMGRRERVKHNATFGIAVRESCWHLGIGAMNMVTAIDFAREAGYRKLNLDARSDNARALALYRRFGFRDVGVRHEHVCVNGEYFDETIMELAL